VKNFEFLGYEDGYLEPTLDVRRDITRVIRRYKPQVVMTFDPEVRFMNETYPNHPDHRAAGSATVDAIFPSARDRLTFPELLTDGLEPHKVEQLWMAPSTNEKTVVDITNTLELKKKALLAHPSQLGDEVPEFATMMAKASAEGQEFEFGEAFRRILFDGSMELPDPD
jgi:LmbE family N-acetylglucosaminyl deacetylase